jgi:hypothetical protein
MHTRMQCHRAAHAPFVSLLKNIPYTCGVSGGRSAGLWAETKMGHFLPGAHALAASRGAKRNLIPPRVVLILLEIFTRRGFYLANCSEVALKVSTG